MSGPTTTHDFRGRSVIVTGSGRGVGLEIARLFAVAGADTFLVDVDRDVVEAAAADVGGHALTASVADTTDVNETVATAVEQTGRVDVLVNNAGVLRDKVLWKLTDEDWASVLDVRQRHENSAASVSPSTRSLPTPRRGWSPRSRATSTTRSRR